MDEWVWYRVTQLLLCFEDAPLSRGFLEASRQTPSPQKEFLISTAAHSAPPLTFTNDFRIVCEQYSWLACECDMIDIQTTENPISPIMAERYMSSQYKVTLRLHIYRLFPNEKKIFQWIYLSTFTFCPNFWVNRGLARWRFWPPVSLVPCSVLLLPTHHCLRILFFSNPEKSDTSSLPLWASPKCDTVISFSETSSARGVQTSHRALHSAVHSAQWDVCLGDDSSFVQSVRFFGSKVRPNGHYWPFVLFSQSSQGCHGLGPSSMNRGERKMGSGRNRCREKYLLSSTIPQKGWKPQNMAWKKTNINTVLLKIDWYWI